ncbi:MAG: hypothetical protein ABJL67_22865 [Sulfitobacter sp.]
MGKDVFLSVGATANSTQEDFVQAIEARLRVEGLTPNTVGRNTFSVDSPLTAVAQLMDRCVGTVVIALERSYFPSGAEKRGGTNETTLAETKLATPWNQIEAAMAYNRGLPLLVVVEKGLRLEGLLEPGYDWYVQSVPLDTSYLTSDEFNGILASWKGKIEKSKSQQAVENKTGHAEVEKMTIGQLVSAVKPAHLWSLLISSAAVIVGAFSVGARFFH